VAALIQSEFGPLPPGRVTAILDQTADGIVCPDAATLALYAPFPQFQNGEPQACQGGRGHNSWYGHGEENALSAVTREARRRSPEGRVGPAPSVRLPPRRSSSVLAVRAGSYASAMTPRREAEELLLIEEADAWFEYLEATRGQTALR